MNKRFVQREENTRGLGREGSLQIKKKHSTGFFGSTGNVIVGFKSSIQETSETTDSDDSLNRLCTS